MHKAQKEDFVFSKERNYGGSSAEVLPLDTFALPANVENGMRVVHQTGQWYLWVDALCITQHDATELQHYNRSISFTGMYLPQFAQ